MNLSFLALARRSLFACFAGAALAAGFAGLAHAGEMTADSTDIDIHEESGVSRWWNGKQMLPFPGRDTIEDYGLTLKGKYYGAFFGVIKGSGSDSRGFWDQGIEFIAEQNFGKLFNVDALNGVKGFGEVRWRDSRSNADPNEEVQADGLFNPTNWASGTQWRLSQFGLEIGSDDMLPVQDMIVLRGGWLRPQKEFVDQPDSKLFLNNAVNSAKGIGGNIPFSSSFSTWGGTLQVKPVETWYLKGGLFMAYPQATATGNHGLAMEGFGPNPSLNGLMAMGETGIKPKIGLSELEGHYAFGGYWWGVDNTSYYGAGYEGQWGLYWQADQMLFRESPPEPWACGKGADDGKTAAAGKSFKTPVSMEPSEFSKQGLRAFNLVTFAPKYNNPFPFYFQSGLVYEGLIPGRDEDLTMISIAYGAYSFYRIEADQDAGIVDQPNYTGIIEGGYRIQINGFSFIQPFFQYLFRPSGSANTPNAGVLGFYVGADF